MRQEVRKFLHDKIADLLGLPLKNVIWANQSGSKPENPMATLLLYSTQSEEMENKLRTKNPEEIDLRVSTGFVLEVQFFGQKKTYPVDILENMIRQMERPTIVDSFFANHVAFLYADPVQDLTGLLENDQQFEPRAAVDLHCRYTSQIIDDPGYIEEVDAEIEVIDPETGHITTEIAGKLIHGNIIQGEPIDMAHSLDVDFSVSVKDRT